MTTDQIPLNAARPEAIDASCRWPVGGLLSKAAGWLCLASFGYLVLALKLVFPGFLSSASWLSYGRVEAAAANAFWFGFVIEAGLAAAVWLTARLGRVEVRHHGAALIGLGLIQIAVLISIIGALAGDSPNLEGYHMPGYAAIPYLAGYILVAACALFQFHDRVDRAVYPSLWFALAGLLWFPWVLGITIYLTDIAPLQGGMQTVIGLWFVQNLKFVVAASFMLAVALYLTPKIAEKPLATVSLALFGFWSLVIVGGWGGAGMGAPFPAWYTAVSTIHVWIYLAPAAAIAAIMFQTVEGDMRAYLRDQSLARVGLGVGAFLLSALLAALINTQSVYAVLGLTYAQAAVDQLFRLGFLVFVFGGAFQYLVPRLGLEGALSEASRRLWLPATAAGLAVSLAGLFLGGLGQGLALNIAEAPFDKSIAYSRLFLYLHAIGMLVFFGAQCLLMKDVVKMGVSMACSVCCPPQKSAENGGALGVEA